MESGGQVSVHVTAFTHKPVSSLHFTPASNKVPQKRPVLRLPDARKGQPGHGQHVDGVRVGAAHPKFIIVRLHHAGGVYVYRNVTACFARAQLHTAPMIKL
jgi:hypothetical protein